MPWQEVSTMPLRQALVAWANPPGANRRALCRRFGFSPPTAYKWLQRSAQEGTAGLADPRRRPQHRPRPSDAAPAARVVALRRQHPAWGGRQLQPRLRALGAAVGPRARPMTAILRRHGRLAPQAARAHRPCQRFERAAPNALGQRDCQGPMRPDAGRWHPWTGLDAHARCNGGLVAGPQDQAATVQPPLTARLRRYGLPAWMLMANGSPWAGAGAHPATPLTVGLRRRGVGVSHGAPDPPPTHGKDARVHRPLGAEALTGHHGTALGHCPQVFDRLRACYPRERPHEAVGMAPPANRYQPSARPFPEAVPPMVYGPADHGRRVHADGHRSVPGKASRLGKGFGGYPVAWRPTTAAGWTVPFCHHQILPRDGRRPSG